MPPELAPRALDLLLRKLLSHSLLSTDDQNAIAALPFTLRRFDAGGFMLANLIESNAISGKGAPVS